MRISRPLDAVKLNLVTIPMTAKVGCSIGLTKYSGAFDDQGQALLACGGINNNCPTVAGCCFGDDGIQIYVKPSVMCEIRTKRIQVLGMPSSN
jgi:hypothetical protein